MRFLLLDLVSKNHSQKRAVQSSPTITLLLRTPEPRVTKSQILLNIIQKTVVSDNYYYLPQFSSVQSLNHVRLFATPWIAARQASLSITNSWSSPKLMSIKSVMPSSHLILCCPLLLLPPVPPTIRVFSNVSTLFMRWPQYWSFSFSISTFKEHPGLISFRIIYLTLIKK